MQSFIPKRNVIITILLLQVSFLVASVPSGYYYFVKNKKQSALKTALHTYCSPLKELDYGSGLGFTWEGFFFTDRRADSTVIDMYSNTVRRQTGFSAVSGMHIEHSFPKSWWGAYQNNAYNDLYHLYPADALANETKNNLPLGEVAGTASFDNGVVKIGVNGFLVGSLDKCFEPADEYKGDFARTYFYISTIYENLAPLMQSPMIFTNNTYPFWKPWALDLLLKWHRQDPVSAKELTRIEAVYSIQGNRNPFIDYPDLAEYIWGKDTTGIFPFPEETGPFLVAPRRGVSIDFGVILQNDTRTQNLHIQGVNLTSDVQVSFIRNSSALSLSVPSISAANATTGIDLGITFKPGASGLIRDTLLITGGGLRENLRIPVKALASADFITLEPADITPVGGTLKWISDPLATQYRLNVYQGDQKAGDLVISSYVEGSSWNKAIELYNGTGKSVDLSKYSLQKQSNGAGYFGSELKLNGSLATGKSFVIVHKSAAVELQSKADLLTDSLLQFNGNDAVALVRGGVTIDMVGKASAGADVNWGADVTLQRKSSVTHPAAVFNQDEWTILPVDSYTMLGAHSMNIASATNYILQNVFTGIATFYNISSLLPENTYTYSVESMRSGVIAPAINTMQLHTSALDVPEISDASDIRSTQFTANWGESPFASGYLLNVFELAGSADTTETEGFDNVGASGTPLPGGWSGTANAVYTTSTSTGIASPSIQLRNAGEWIQTKAYPQAVTKLAYMYRFVTSVVGASFILEGYSAGSWVRIDSIPCKNNSKAYPVYNFTKNQAFSAFRFTFNKMPGGNFSIDDISATYGSQDTVYIRKDYPVSVNQVAVSDLKEDNRYYYAVRATLGSFVSGTSETISVHTLTSTKIALANTTAIRILAYKEKVVISGLRGDELIQVYSLTGVCVYQTNANTTQINIPLKQPGVFILKVQNPDYNFAGKFINW